ncbi:IS21 family transposase [Rhodobacteraceae bacterium ASV31]|uniref:IS21 family transposase n=1 Tax=Anianabacter salinae TaxID=2851023 RepID=UPI003898E26B|nr:IS21 family transposase [Anianabacter salinae]
MTDLQDHSQRTAAARAGFSERTARRFDADPTLPSNRKIVHGRTAADPLQVYWQNDLLPLLEKDSALQAVTLLRHLQSEHPLAFPDDRIRRTLERRVRQWRALNNPERDSIFRQTPEPGYMAQSDFTHAEELEVTIAGQPFPHLLYHFVMVYSRWEHVGVVLGGESFTALAENLQQALWSLGGAPQNHRTDSLSAAFRNLTADEREDMTRRYSAFVGHFGMDASRNNRGEAHENAAVESQHRHLKKAIEQALILRGSRDFACIEDYRRFVDFLVARRNRQRAAAVQAERAHPKPLPPRRTTDFTEIVVPVARTGGFLVKSIFYSTPSQLIGQRLRVHLYDDRLEEALLGSTLVVSHLRARGRVDGHRVHVINYHHVVNALRRKPQALWTSIYRDSLFPRTEYAEAWKVLQRDLPRREACRRMVDLLFIAHDQTCEAELAHLLADDPAAGRVPDPDLLASRLSPMPTALPRNVAVAHPSLDSFDALLGARA